MSYFGPHKLGLLEDNISAQNGYFSVSEIKKKKGKLNVPNGRCVKDALISVSSEERGSRSLF